MPEWAERVITWEEAAEYIAGGTVESLGRLRRSQEQLTTYRAAMDQVPSRGRRQYSGAAAALEAQITRPATLQVRRDYASVADFITITVLERTSRVNGGACAGGRLRASTQLQLTALLTALLGCTHTPTEGKKEAVDGEHGMQQLVWHLNVSGGAVVWHEGVVSARCQAGSQTGVV
jgi:hypothetical protein